MEQGVSHMWTVSALQQHARSTFVVDEPATAELKVSRVSSGHGSDRSASPKVVTGPKILTMLYVGPLPIYLFLIGFDRS